MAHKMALHDFSMRPWKLFGLPPFLRGSIKPRKRSGGGCPLRARCRSSLKPARAELLRRSDKKCETFLSIGGNPKSKTLNSGKIPPKLWGKKLLKGVFKKKTFSELPLSISISLRSMQRPSSIDRK